MVASELLPVPECLLERPSCGAGDRLGSRLWAKIETGTDSKLRLLVKSIEICRPGTTRTIIISNRPNTAAQKGGNDASVMSVVSHLAMRYAERTRWLWTSLFLLFISC